MAGSKSAGGILSWHGIFGIKTSSISARRGDVSAGGGVTYQRLGAGLHRQPSAVWRINGMAKVAYGGVASMAAEWRLCIQLSIWWRRGYQATSRKQ